MFSWNTIRTLCAILLLIPIVHLAYLVSREMLASLDAAPTAWAQEVEAYAAADRIAKLPVKPILIVGSRQVKLWEGLEDLFRPRPVLMRGLGNATMDDIRHYHSELIAYYQPSALVLLPGSSEFHIRDNKSATELFRSIRKLIELDESYRITRNYYVFAPLKTPAYPEDNLKIDETTQLLAQWAQPKPEVTILDANALLALRDGAPNPDYFRLDGINLNEHGYLRISLLLQNSLASAAEALQTGDN